MATMADNSVNLILCDPPYNITEYGKNIKFDNRKDFKGVISEAWDVDFNPATLRKNFERILAPKGNIMAFTASNLIGDYYAAFNDYFTTNVAVWAKTNPPPRVRKAGFLSACDYIMCHWVRGEPHTWNFTNQRDMRNIIEGPICQGKERLDHPTQKPLFLMKKLVLLASNPGDLVYDPFMGVGSTGEAALTLGRSFVGTDINEWYFEQAEKRLRNCVKQPSLF
jgi:DNA modification methylase